MAGIPRQQHSIMRIISPPVSETNPQRPRAGLCPTDGRVSSLNSLICESDSLGYANPARNAAGRRVKGSACMNPSGRRKRPVGTGARKLEANRNGRTAAVFSLFTFRSSKKSRHVPITAQNPENLYRRRVCSVDDEIAVKRPEANGSIGEVLSNVPHSWILRESFESRSEARADPFRG